MKEKENEKEKQKDDGARSENLRDEEVAAGRTHRLSDPEHSTDRGPNVPEICLSERFL